MEILFEDNQLVVCIKPIGLDSEDGVIKELEKQCSGKLYCVHRLDKAVGGLMVYAKNSECASALSRLIAQNGFIKEYLAVIPDKLEIDSGRFSDLLFHDRQKNRSYTVKRMRAGVKTAELEYEKLAAAGGLCLVKVRLITGRSHQIRCQFASRAMPLAGDVKYGSTLREHPIALYAFHLRFRHPFGSNMVDITSIPENGYWTVFALEKQFKI